MKHALIAILVLILAKAGLAQDALTEKIDGLLSKIVAEERVDYDRAAREHREELANLLDRLSQTDPATLHEQDRLAFYINLYNLTMIQAVLDRGGVTFKSSDANFQVFKDPIVRLNGKTISLNDLENGLVRSQFRDARIHAALVCGAVSCPPILNKAYRGETLDRQLDANVKNWLNDPKRNVIDDQNKTLKLSAIFDWYADDFGGKTNLAKWISRQLGRDVGAYKIEFKEYDWSLNKSE